MPAKNEAKPTEEGQAEEEALAREKQGVTVAWLSTLVWKRLDQGSREELAELVYGGFDPGRFLAFFGERGTLGGFGLGPPPEEGEVEDGQVA
jgi:hypothetical protein